MFPPISSISPVPPVPPISPVPPVPIGEMVKWWSRRNYANKFHQQP